MNELPITSENELKALIINCGDNFRRLTLHHNCVGKSHIIAKRGKDMKWQASPNQHISPVKKSYWGKTPEEAVYNLYMEINKQKALNPNK